jgi:hypothetical protein
LRAGLIESFLAAEMDLCVLVREYEKEDVLSSNNSMTVFVCLRGAF